MMRILQIVPRLSQGGVSRVVLNYWEKIDKSEFQFDFITHEEKSGKLDFLISQGCSVFYCKTIGKIGLLCYYKNLKSILSRKHYDAVHIHVGHITGVYALLCRRLGVKRIICHAHTTTAPNLRHQKWMPVLRMLSVKNSTDLVACGKEAGRFCFGNTPFMILGNGLDFQKIMLIGKASVESLREQLQLITCGCVLGSVADFNYLKNHKFLIDVFSLFLKEKPNSKLVLVGNGELQISIKGYVEQLGLQNNVVFLGQRSDVYLLLNLFDALLLPSLHEGMPMSVIEAQASGVPCLISDTIDRTVDCRLGLVKFLSIQKPQVWVDELLKTEKHEIEPEVREEALIKSGFDINSSVRALEDLYRRTANGRG
jgi:glycosyltransferase EpsF